MQNSFHYFNSSPDASDQHPSQARSGLSDNAVNGASPDAIVDQVKRCPSGALTYELLKKARCMIRELYRGATWRIRLVRLLSTLVVGATLGLLPLGPDAVATNLISHAPRADDGDTKSVVLYSGVDFVEDAHFFYNGAIVALNSDISRSGFLLHGFLGTGDYDYLNDVPGGKVDGDVTWLRGMIGYQMFATNMRFTAYVGVDWQDNVLNPKDPGNPVSGSETGLLVQGEAETLYSNPLYLGLFGQYSTANDWYWFLVRGGYRFRRTLIGPEGSFFGNVGFDGRRAGAFVNFPVLIKRHVYLGVVLSGGYQWIGGDDSFGNGGYGNVSFYTVF